MTFVLSEFSRREVLLLSIAGLAFSGPRRLLGVEPGKPSRTAVAVATMRALCSQDPDPSTRNPDYLAKELLTAQDREMLEGAYLLYDTFGMSWPELVEYFNEELGTRFANHPGFLPYVFLNLRTRHLDTAVSTALKDGTEQIIILGAGLDSRGYRLTSSWEAGRVFEVDFPPTQEYKKQRVADAIGDVPRNLSYVPIDFTRETLEEVLPRHGYRPDAKTLITWEGVSMYLPKAAIENTLQFVARHTGPGSSIVFDYLDERIITQDHNDEVWTKWAEIVSEWGEPWIFGVPNSAEGNIFQIVVPHGLRVKSDYTMGELCVQYLPPKVLPATFGLARWAWRMCWATQGSVG